MAAILATFAAYRRALQPANDDRSTTRWLLWTAAAAALAFLLRPDGLLVAAAVGLHWLVTRRRVAWQPVALFAALSLPWLVFAWLTYGSPVPNTLVAKATQGLGEEVPRLGPWAGTGWRQVGATVPRGRRLGLCWTGACVRAPAIRPFADAAMGSPGHRGAHPAWACAAISGTTLRSRPCWPCWPVTGPLPASAGWPAVSADRTLPAWRRAFSRSRWRWRCSFRRLRPRPHWLNRRSRAAASRPTSAPARFCVSCALRSEDTPQVGMAEIGLIGYVSDCPIVDFAGLLQRDVAHLRVSPADKMAWTIQRYQPELLVLSGGTSYPSAAERTTLVPPALRTDRTSRTRGLPQRRLSARHRP